MPMSLNLEIRARLARYLTGEGTLREFRDWFLPTTWDIHLTGDRGTIALVGEVGLRIDEFTSGHRTEADLRSLLVPLVARYAIGSDDLELTASSTTIRSDISLPVRVVHTRPEVASVS